MMDRTTDRKLAGRQVVFTGRLALMARSSAIELVERHGGSVAPTVNRQTSFLVVGREGWPLRSDGRLTRKLEQARRLQRARLGLEIVPEERFFAMLEGEASGEHQRLYTIAELAQLLGTSRSQIETWQRNGLIAATAHREGIPHFSFAQVAGARSLCAFLDAGVPRRRLLRSIRQLQCWLSDEVPVGDLLPGLLHDGSRFLFREESGRLVEMTGQRLFEFSEEPAPSSATVSWSPGSRDDELFEQAVLLEREGRLDEAAARYREVLLAEGPDADVCFNLANVLHAMGEIQAAIERFHEAITLDPRHADAWNNLGNLLAERNRLEEACHAYRQAVSVDPSYADAHYGLADSLEQAGRLDEARPHWRTYLEYEPVGPWADYARSRLSARAG
jgi:DNA-binding transcriptional MerR regulator